MMKRIKTITLAALLVSGTAYAQATDSKTQIVTANMAAEVSLTLGTAPGQQELSTTGTNDIPIALTVNSTNGFKIYATTEAVNNGDSLGHFNEYSIGTSSYVTGGAFVNAPHTVTVATDSDGTGDTATLPAAIADDSALIYSSNSALEDKALTATLKVTPPYGTPRLTDADKVYRMVITYTLNVNP